MSEEHDSKEPKMLNRRKVLSALGASTVGIAGLGVGSASEGNETAELDHDDLSEKEAREIVGSDAREVLKTLRDQGIIDHARLSELEFEPLVPGETVDSSGFIGTTYKLNSVNNSSHKEQNIKKRMLVVTKKMENGELYLFISRTSKDAYATFVTDNEVMMYDETSVENVTTNTCFTQCWATIGCGKTWLNPLDRKKTHFKIRNGECLPAYTTCCG